jgi:hypothetical protein
MQTKTIYEEEILKDIQDLPENLQKKLTKIVHFLKKEILLTEVDEKRMTNLVMPTFFDPSIPSLFLILRII